MLSRFREGSRFARALALVPLLLSVGGCPADPAPSTSAQPVGDGDGEGRGDGDRGTGDGDVGDGDDEGTGDGDNAGFCQVKKVEAEPVAPEVLIVLDRSMSMIGINYDFTQAGKDRWTPAVSAINKLVKDLHGSVRFGLTVFPVDGDVCAPGKLDVPIGGTPAQIAAALEAQYPRTFSTPTALALEAAAKSFGKPKPGSLSDRYVLLVTDGQPTCDPDPLYAIIADPRAVTHTNAAIDALRALEIKTFVVGFDAQSGGFAANLDDFAKHGGTEKSVDATDEKSLIEQLRKIAGKVVSCVFDLESAPVDPTYVEVTLDGKLVRLNERDGWSIADKTVTLQNGSCATLQDGAAHSLAIRVLCEPLL